MNHHKAGLTFCIISTLVLTENSFADIFDSTPHQLIALHSNKCVDIRAPKNAGDSAIIQMTCNGEPSQQWKAILLKTDEYQLVSAENGMCLDVSGASKANGGLIKQSPCINSRANQTWFIQETANNAYQIISKNSGKCLDVNNASEADNIQLQQWDCGLNKNKLWRVEGELTPSAPIVINGKNNITIAHVKISNPTGPCILVKGNSSNITIKDSELGPCKTDTQNRRPDLTHVGAGVFVTGSEGVTVNNVSIHDTEDAGITIFYGSRYMVTNNLITKTAGSAIKAQGISNIIIKNNKINTVGTGIYVASSSNAQVLNNNLAHIQGTPRANFVQFNKVTGAGNRIMCNSGIQDAYGTVGSLDSIEDNISLYASSGTSSDPILVVGNKVKHGGPSKTGSGIMLGDNGGSNIIARDNVVVNSGNVGIGVSGGTNIQVINNKLFSVALPITNNAIPVWNYNMGAVLCDHIMVTGNQVHWMTPYGPERKVWSNSTCTNTEFNSNVFMDTNITASIFDTYNSPECKQ